MLFGEIGPHRLVPSTGTDTCVEEWSASHGRPRAVPYNFPSQSCYSTMLTLPTTTLFAKYMYTYDAQHNDGSKRRVRLVKGKLIPPSAMLGVLQTNEMMVHLMAIRKQSPFFQDTGCHGERRDTGSTPVCVLFYTAWLVIICGHQHASGRRVVSGFFNPVQPTNQHRPLKCPSLRISTALVTCCLLMQSHLSMLQIGNTNEYSRQTA